MPRFHVQEVLQRLQQFVGILSGAYLGASAVVFGNIDVAEVLKTLAIREALALSEDLYLHKIAIVSDCQVAVDAIKVGTSASYGAY